MGLKFDTHVLFGAGEIIWRVLFFLSLFNQNKLELLYIWEMKVNKTVMLEKWKPLRGRDMQLKQVAYCILNISTLTLYYIIEKKVTKTEQKQ